MSKKLSDQARNSIELYLGQNPYVIASLLVKQSESVLNEIKSYYNCYNVKELAILCSMGK